MRVVYSADFVRERVERPTRLRRRGEGARPIALGGCYPAADITAAALFECVMVCG